MAARVGLGVDVHRFSDQPGRPLVLGGVAVPGVAGLEGHSDADVVAHALADALLGAAGLGDLGQHFPDTDPAWAGADSMVILSQVAEMVKGAGFRLENGDCTVLLESPKLAPHRADMERRLSLAAGGPVTVKATRPEALGALGRREGAACLAVVVLEGGFDGP
jgi:2-C-methyl-D-erythritol 2,4-cyclodiphosphate synthase